MKSDKELERDEEEGLRALFDATAANPAPDRLERMLARAAEIPATAGRPGWRRWLEARSWLPVAGPLLAAAGLALFLLPGALERRPGRDGLPTPIALLTSTDRGTPGEEGLPVGEGLEETGGPERGEPGLENEPTTAGEADGGSQVALVVDSPFSGLGWDTEEDDEPVAAFDAPHARYAGASDEAWLAVYDAMLNL